MSKAIPGNGQVRKSIVEASEELDRALGYYARWITTDEARFRNNMDTPTAAAQLEFLDRVSKEVVRLRPVIEAAYKHHVDQRSVLPNNAFGLRRRIHTIDGVKRVVVEDVANANQVNAASVMKVVMALPASERAAALARAENPGEGWSALDLEEKTAYIQGRLDLPPVPPLA